MSILKITVLKRRGTAYRNGFKKSTQVENGEVPLSYKNVEFLPYSNVERKWCGIIMRESHTDSRMGYFSRSDIIVVGAEEENWTI